MGNLDYERFVKRHFAAVYVWCACGLGDGSQAAIAAQRIVLDFYRAGSRESAGID